MSTGLAKADPALAAIQKLDDDLGASFDVVAKDLGNIKKDVSALDERQREDTNALRAAIAEREPRGAPKPAVRGWRNPGKLEQDATRVWEWWRGRLLSAAGDEGTRERGFEVMERAMPGELARVRDFYRRSEAETAAFSTSTDFVPLTLQPIMDHVRGEPAYIEDVGQVIEMQSGTHRLPKEATAPAAANYAENATIAEDANTVASTDLISIKGAKLRHFSIEAVQDAAPDVIKYWIRRIVDSVNELETKEALEGGNFVGVKTAVGVGEVSLANAGAALANLDALAEMATTIPASERDPARCAWFMSSGGLRALLQIKEGTNLRPMLGIDALPTQLFGFRIIVSDRIATTVGTPDTSTVYFGNWRGLAVGRRGPDMVDVVSYGAGTAFASGQVSVRVIRRYATAVHLPSLLVRGISLRVAA